MVSYTTVSDLLCKLQLTFPAVSSTCFFEIMRRNDFTCWKNRHPHKHHKSLGCKLWQIKHFNSDFISYSKNSHRQRIWYLSCTSALQVIHTLPTKTNPSWVQFSPLWTGDILASNKTLCFTEPVLMLKSYISPSKLHLSFPLVLLQPYLLSETSWSTLYMKRTNEN